ncbi:hypothetical protein A3715_03295 [Oleiphilus sp. HI0009]|uniref:biotin--[acetyl-CoA-carboxylase] ligase n=1 Tax=unclassified Oleiphilus TaxID=2631174 RepID=UPI0007C24F5E|nr:MULTISPECIES: biotin--[acetyl-CoA-carboxylase] ligase [unclassified Oleiphilus]KZX72636.1 hypothetical protein A3715_03295 [Oleiphilus sp. HI0009]KZY61403.1 hypothetical protein A3738_14005 [Oleiphilus sp. HI0066]KZY67520.1 hypothetical protein A3739_21500 [Oleiphilus sp. HI0067]KZY76054.1 hypothetical protein A3739_14250 [Oleiphilus sp. HI0067]KZZ63419.1 hypothetical protein A3762_00040 [Oleiphilus sp. HI0125]
MHLSNLISVLADGEFHSGSELGERFGVSRTAIWKALEGLEGLGLDYESHRGKGYRLLSPIDLLDKSKILNFVSDSHHADAQIEVVDTCASTNTDVHSISANLPYRVLFSEQQSAGRGRRGRDWVSPFGQNLYFSVCFEWFKGPAALQGLSIVVGIALAQVLKGLNVTDVGLKWPNDIWISDKKAAGILIELSGEATGSWLVTIGIGMNVSMSERQASQIDQPWTAIAQHVDVERNELAGRLLESLLNNMSIFREKGFEAYVDEYGKFDALKNRSVKVIGPDVEGVALGVDLQGGLQLKVDDGVKVFHSGEVSVRPI